jgi:hypothetical protein
MEYGLGCRREARRIGVGLLLWHRQGVTYRRWCLRKVGFPRSLRNEYGFANCRKVWDAPFPGVTARSNMVYIGTRTEVLQPHLKLLLLRRGARGLLRLIAMDLNSAAPVRRCHSPNLLLLFLPQPNAFRSTFAYKDTNSQDPSSYDKSKSNDWKK